MNKYQYSIATITNSVDPDTGKKGFRIVVLEVFEAFADGKLNEVLEGLPNHLASEEAGNWETYGMMQVGDAIVLLIKKLTTRILVPNGVIYRR